MVFLKKRNAGRAAVSAFAALVLTCAVTACGFKGTGSTGSAGTGTGTGSGSVNAGDSAGTGNGTAAIPQDSVLHFGNDAGFARLQADMEAGDIPVECNVLYDVMGERPDVTVKDEEKIREIYDRLSQVTVGEKSMTGTTDSYHHILFHLRNDTFVSFYFEGESLFCWGYDNYYAAGGGPLWTYVRQLQETAMESDRQKTAAKAGADPTADAAAASAAGQSGDSKKDPSGNSPRTVLDGKNPTADTGKNGGKDSGKSALTGGVSSGNAENREVTAQQTVGELTQQTSGVEGSGLEVASAEGIPGNGQHADTLQGTIPAEAQDAAQNAGQTNAEDAAQNAGQTNAEDTAQNAGQTNAEDAAQNAGQNNAEDAAQNAGQNNAEDVAQGSDRNDHSRNVQMQPDPGAEGTRQEGGAPAAGMQSEGDPGAKDPAAKDDSQQVAEATQGSEETKPGELQSESTQGAEETKPGELQSEATQGAEETKPGELQSEAAQAGGTSAEGSLPEGTQPGSGQEDLLLAERTAAMNSAYTEIVRAHAAVLAMDRTKFLQDYENGVYSVSMTDGQDDSNGGDLSGSNAGRKVSAGEGADLEAGAKPETGTPDPQTGAAAWQAESAGAAGQNSAAETAGAAGAAGQSYAAESAGAAGQKSAAGAAGAAGQNSAAGMADSEGSAVDPRINYEMFREYFANPEESDVFYGLRDYNGDGTPELVIALGTAQFKHIWAGYTFDGQKAVPLFTGKNSLGYRVDLYTLSDGSFMIHGSGGATAGRDTIARIAAGGTGLEILAEYEYDEQTNGTMDHIGAAETLSDEDFQERYWADAKPAAENVVFSLVRGDSVVQQVDATTE